MESGGRVLLFASPNLPAGMLAEDPDGIDRPGNLRYNVYEFFTPFRTGWDHGNAATIIAEHSVMRNIPYEAFCDLQFFELIHGSAPFRVVAFPGDDKTIIIRSIGLQRGDSKERYTEKTVASHAYLLESTLGKGSLIGYAMNLSPRPAAVSTLHDLVRYAHVQGLEKD